jgi:hypothetical protein
LYLHHAVINKKASFKIFETGFLKLVKKLLSIIPFWQIIQPAETYQKQNQGGNKCGNENFSIII